MNGGAFTMMADTTQSLRFDGSVWCNLDIALRSVDQIFRQSIRPDNLTVIEWYVLRALYERDGQNASELANAVGRAATSFTPNLDKLQDKEFIERRPDETDRRAVRIYLTEKAMRKREEVLHSAREVDSQINEMIGDGDFETFLKVLLKLQNLSE